MRIRLRTIENYRPENIFIKVITISRAKNMMSKIISIIVSSSIIGLLHALIKNDEIIKLPGYNSSLPSKQYSGYLKASDTSNLHYWLVESESNPLTDPVVIW